MFNISHTVKKGDYLYAHTAHAQAQEKFNGKLVAELTGLSGKDLGELMGKFSKQWENKKNQEEWARNTSPEDIKDAILAFGKEGPEL